LEHGFPYQSLGHTSLPTLVFLHGFLGRGADWLPIAEDLSSDYHCLLPDLPGHGANTNLDPALPLTFDLLAGGLSATLDSAGIERPALIGYSLGGRLALHYACTRGDRLSALVIESASPGLRTEAERSDRRALDDERAARLRAAGMKAFLETWYRADLWASLRARPDLLSTLIDDRRAADPLPAARALTDLSPGRSAPVWDCLPALRIPVLLLSGDLDPAYTRILSEAAGLIPGSTHVRIDDAGHNIHLEQPVKFVASLQSFLRGIFLSNN
jgi:2-succinyl-6-hydroxy-2,4-cyclohexadiene-1-carboxylate synthase